MNAQEKTAHVYEQSKVMSFRFSENNQEIKAIFIKEEPWWFAKEICDLLDIKTKDVRTILDTDEVATFKEKIANVDNIDIQMQRVLNKHTTGKDWHFIPPVAGRSPLMINESGLYSLILKSRKPNAKAFRKWVTSEVLPTIRKKGFYRMGSKANDFIDARDVPHSVELINNYRVTVIYLNEKMYLINDLNRAIQSTTSANQIVKKLNAKRQLATKIWLFGQTNPTWFTTELGKQLIFSGSRIENRRQQLLLPLPTQRGGVQ